MADAVNSRVHSAVGAPPSEVEGNEMLSLLILAKKSRNLERNSRNVERQRARLEVHDQFRTLLPVNNQRAHRRAFKPRFGDEVHTVRRVLEGGRVESTSGRIHKVKLIQPTGGRARMRARTRRPIER